jgi:hypothetical protein
MHAIFFQYMLNCNTLCAIGFYQVVKYAFNYKGTCNTNYTPYTIDNGSVIVLHTHVLTLHPTCSLDNRTSHIMHAFLLYHVNYKLSNLYSILSEKPSVIYSHAKYAIISDTDPPLITIAWITIVLFVIIWPCQTETTICLWPTLYKTG